MAELSLKEKLMRLQSKAAEPEAAPEASQCACGSHLVGECPDCDGADEPPILRKLRALGDQKAVNPPPTEKEPETEPSKDADGSGPPSAKDADGSGPPSAKETCPTCGKRFKHLSRHKCKEVSPPPEEIDPPPEVAEVDGMVDRLGDGLREIGVLPKAADEAKPDPRLEKVAGTLNKITIDQKKRIQMLEEENDELNKVAVDRWKQIEELTKKLEFKKKQIEVCDQVDEMRAASRPALSGFIVLLDCLEHQDLGTGVVALADLVGPLADAVAQENGVPHWKCVEYGGGPGQLAARLDRLLEAEPPVGFVRCSSGELETSACLAVLKKHAKNIIQGVR